MTNEPSGPQLPVQSSTRSFWQDQTHELSLSNDSNIDNIPEDCDIAIIGGGYAGVSTAYHLLKTVPNPTSLKILLLEARDACSGATSRNGGHLRPDYMGAAARSCDRYGSVAAADVVSFEAKHVEALKELIEEEGIECDFEETSSFEVFTTFEQVAVAEEKYHLLKSLPAFEATMADVNFYVGENAPRLTGMADAKGYFTTPAAHLSPYKLTMALLARAVRMGLLLKTHTPVLSITTDSFDHGQGKDRLHRMLTPEREVTARQVIFASNAYTSVVLPEYTDVIVPCEGLVCHITTPDGHQLPQLPAGSYAIREEGEEWSGYNYIIQKTDNTIVLGGAHHLYKSDLPSWYNNADDGSIIDSARDYMASYMQRSFIGWEDSHAIIDQVWTGIMGYSTDSLPHVGQLPGRDGIFTLSGFDGHGMPVAFLAAKGVAEMVSKGKSYEETCLPTLFKTTSERLSSKYDDILQRSPVNFSNTIRRTTSLES